MLRITPYLGIIVLIVSIGGLFYPILGFFLLAVFMTLLIISPFKGRWFCGNLCPRGSFNDYILSKISFKKSIPKIFKSLWIRIPIFVLMMGFMILRLVQTKGIMNQIGMVFVIMCLVTTTIAVIFGIFINPRSWCSFCPMGTAQRFLGRNSKYHIIVDKDKCIHCKICHNVCPMGLKVNQILNDPDCIKCGRCIDKCPKKIIRFKK
jgi:ferredoxin-type protein NapH